jgi:hypothetical protein
MCVSERRTFKEIMCEMIIFFKAKKRKKLSHGRKRKEDGKKIQYYVNEIVEKKFELRINSVIFFWCVVVVMI